MKRTKFLAYLLTIAATPLIAVAKIQKVAKRNSEGFKINSGEGRIYGHIFLKGVNANTLDVKLSGSDTNGDLAIFEQTSLSQGKGTPLHLHHSQDEIFYVMQGAYYFQVGEQKYNLKTGDSIFLPRKVPHAWTQVSKEGRMTVTLQPAGKLEDFFVALAGLDHEPTEKEVEELFSDNEMEIVGPPLKVATYR